MANGTRVPVGRRGEREKKRENSAEDLRGRIQRLSRSIGQRRVLFGVRTGWESINLARVCVQHPSLCRRATSVNHRSRFLHFNPRPGHYNLSPPSCVTSSIFHPLRRCPCIVARLCHSPVGMFLRLLSIGVVVTRGG